MVGGVLSPHIAALTRRPDINLTHGEERGRRRRLASDTEPAEHGLPFLSPPIAAGATSGSAPTSWLPVADWRSENQREIVACRHSSRGHGLFLSEEVCFVSELPPFPIMQSVV